MQADTMRVNSNISCTRSRIRSAFYEPIPVLLPYVGSFCHLWAIPLLLTCFGRFVLLPCSQMTATYRVVQGLYARQCDRNKILVSHSM